MAHQAKSSSFERFKYLWSLFPRNSSVTEAPSLRSASHSPAPSSSINTTFRRTLHFAIFHFPTGSLVTYELLIQTGVFSNAAAHSGFWLLCLHIRVYLGTHWVAFASWTSSRSRRDNKIYQKSRARRRIAPGFIATRAIHCRRKATAQVPRHSRFIPSG